MKNNPLLKKLNLRYLLSLLISIVLAFIIGAGILLQAQHLIVIALVFCHSLSPLNGV